ncbi:hypothetical protein OE88DRAFT_1648537 [Heliocybe sulcata]|uniref:Uncharacterized protein n=1 Tax=Heliocybe sulcata TaxID=5364 RepID=A0A5C3MP62_9AGAM|nr:hypothetical protein OE88DRAFT_1648537 [Heliocybe sulcata]
MPSLVQSLDIGIDAAHLHMVPGSQVTFAWAHPHVNTTASPRRIVVETLPGGIQYWKYVPDARREEGVCEEGPWPRMILFNRTIQICHQVQWELFKLHPCLDCFVPKKPRLPEVSLTYPYLPTLSSPEMMLDPVEVIASVDMSAPPTSRISRDVSMASVSARSNSDISMASLRTVTDVSMASLRMGSDISMASQRTKTDVTMLSIRTDALIRTVRPRNEDTALPSKPRTWWWCGTTEENRDGGKAGRPAKAAHASSNHAAAAQLSAPKHSMDRGKSLSCISENGKIIRPHPPQTPAQVDRCPLANAPTPAFFAEARKRLRLADYHTLLQEARLRRRAQQQLREEVIIVAQAVGTCLEDHVSAIIMLAEILASERLSTVPRDKHRRLSGRVKEDMDVRDGTISSPPNGGVIDVIKIYHERSSSTLSKAPENRNQLQYSPRLYQPKPLSWDAWPAWVATEQWDLSSVATPPLTAANHLEYMETAPQGKKDETNETLDEQRRSNNSNTPSISSASSPTTAFSCSESSPIWGEPMARSDYGMRSAPEQTPWPTGLFSASLGGERLARSDYAEEFVERRVQAKYGLIGGHISRNESGAREYGVIRPPKHDCRKCREPQDDFSRVLFHVLDSHSTFNFVV